MFGVDLPIIWFVLVAFLFAGYFLLEGFDFGVGMLLPFVGRDERRRKAMLGTIGPVWDGNEVWLITAGGALFAAFPEWYASMFSGFYLPLFLILLALIVRIVGLEWRSKVHEDSWRAWCDGAIVFGSWLPPILWGVAVANLIRGVPLGADKTMDSGFGTLIGLLNPYALLGGAAFAAVFALHAVAFLRLKTAGTLRDAVGRAMPIPAVTALIAGSAFLLWTQLAHGKAWVWIPLVVAAAALALAVVAIAAGRDGLGFVASSVAVVAVTVVAFGSMYPFLMPSTLPGGVSLDIWNSSSNPYTLKIMTWAAIAVTPLVLAYQAWTYWSFRRRLTAEPATD
nr:cytochrome d ubiquinol oxidase subunit II [Corynebacterium lactis]